MDEIKNTDTGSSSTQVEQPASTSPTLGERIKESNRKLITGVLVVVAAITIFIMAYLLTS